MKNECGKFRKVNNPYFVYRNNQGWEWRILKCYQSEDGEAKNPYARWMCAVKSPMTHGSYDMGDVYVNEVKSNGRKIECGTVILEKW
jgi:hypothetical protein